MAAILFSPNVCYRVYNSPKLDLALRQITTVLRVQGHFLWLSNFRIRSKFKAHHSILFSFFSCLIRL